jgi:hypothetical protein
VFLDRIQVSHLAWRAAVQFSLAGDQLRAIDRAFGLAADAPDWRVGQFDQAELDFVDRERLACHTVEVTNGFRGQRRLFARNGKAFVAPLDADVKAGFDLADVLVERAAQIGQQSIVDRGKRQADRLALRCRLSLLG